MPESVSISFPHLGIALKNLGNSFSLFGIDIAFYGMIIGCGMILAMALAFRDAKQSGQNVDNYVDLAIYGIIFAIIGARTYYVIFEWSYYKDHLSEIINLRKGGLAIYGGIIAGVLVCLILACRRKLSFWKMLDTGAIGLVTGQMIGRWGNFFNREAYGKDTDSLFAMRINIKDPNVSVNVQPGVTVIDNSYIQVHPTFLYESFWCFCILIFIQCMKRKKKFDGEVFLWYITAYAAGRFFIEGLRTDQLQIGSTGIAVSQLLSAVLVLVGAFLIVYNRIRIQQGKETVIIGKKVNPVALAMDFAKQAHEGQKWTLPDGKDISYFEGHLMGVYHIVEEGGVQDDELLVTALLHDILEDTQVTEKQLRNMFGIRIADNVKWLTRREGLSYEQYIDELLAHGSDEARLVKLADRLHNTNNLMNLGSEQWHEKKIDQAKYMLDKFPEREFAEKYRKTAEKLMQTIKTEVERLEENAGR